MAGRERVTRRDGLAVALAIALVALLLIGSMAVVLAASANTRTPRRASVKPPSW